MKKIILINGSPRKGGNCDSITEKAAEVLRASGAEVFEFDIRDKKVGNCLGCNACKKPGGTCVQKDDAYDLIGRLAECDGILLASPIYFAQIPGTVKVLIDRFFVLFHPATGGLAAPEGGRKLGIVFSFGGGPAEVYAKVAKFVAFVFGTVGVNAHRTVLCGGCHSLDSFSGNSGYQAEVEALAKWLAE